MSTDFFNPYEDPRATYITPYVYEYKVRSNLIQNNLH